MNALKLKIERQSYGTILSIIIGELANGKVVTVEMDEVYSITTEAGVFDNSPRRREARFVVDNGVLLQLPPAPMAAFSSCTPAARPIKSIRMRNGTVYEPEWCAA